MKLSELFDRSELLKIYQEIFDQAKIVNVSMFRAERRMEIILHSAVVIKKEYLIDVSNEIRNLYGLRGIKLLAKYPKELFNEDYYPQILFYIEKKYPHLHCFMEGCKMERSGDTLLITLKENGLDILAYNNMDGIIRELIKDEFDLEFHVQIRRAEGTKSNSQIIAEHARSEEEMLRDIRKTVAAAPEFTKPKEPSTSAADRPQRSSERGDYRISYVPMQMKEITQYSGKVMVQGEIFQSEIREFNNSVKGCYTLYMTDNEASLIVKIIDRKETLYELADELKDGTCVCLKGETMYDKYLSDFVLSVKPKDIEVIDKTLREDKSSEKRVELHMHTNVSEMDGMTPVQDLIKTAKRWGHKAIAVTDHGVVQAFPDAYAAAKKNDIKLIYGVEGYLINDAVEIVYGSKNYSLDDEYIVFDIETTGLNATNDRITEIGAVRMKGGEILDRFSAFVNPQIPIPPKIVELTSITDAMVADAPTIDVVLKDFLEFVGDRVLVAHNANFDIGFIKQKSVECGYDFHPVYIDTVEMSRALLPELKKHKLNIVAEHLGVSLEGHHRAVNDAECLAGIFKIFLEKCRAKEIACINEINQKAHSGEKNLNSLKPYHIVILVKNKKGLRHLYELISMSHLQYYHKRPRIPKSVLMQYREGLILGSACEAGELYRAMLAGKPFDELCNIAKFYDYLEIQPEGNNMFMLNNGTLKSVEEIRDINRRIVDLAHRLDKPIAATGDVHFLDPSDAAYRAILMAGHGFSDADNQAPLYFKTTDEMLEEFSYLGKDTAFEVVVTNPNRIADMIDENFEPIPSVKHPPVIEGAAEDIRSMTYSKAYEIYGDPLPQLVEDRIQKELNSIINNGFSVMYLIAQKLVKKSLDDGYLVGSRGSVGSSFVAFLSGITEVNSLCAHYICENCKHSEFIEDGSYSSGCDMPDKVCPECGQVMKKDGHDIPFETFLGFDGDKEPDIDLNFSGEYQGRAHKYIEELFGEGHVFRAGTMGTIADKTAYGYVKKYLDERGRNPNNAEIARLTKGCTGVKRTTGQHPGGIMIVPKENNVFEFTPIQHPANDVNSDIITTHFDYHKLHDTLLKLDILGHDDPTMLRMLQDLTGLDPKTIPLGDEATMSLFLNTSALGVTEEDINSKVGTFGVPEFGTKFVRQMLEDTKPTTFAELVRISGLSHGTDVWLNNAQTIVQQEIAELKDTICTRDDIMLYLLLRGMDPKQSFVIMEQVRKGKGLKEDQEQAMREHDVPEWYIDSCKKIKYMFPKAHAVAYVTMAFRVAYFKVHLPLAYYATYFSVRADDFDADLMTGGKHVVQNNIKEMESRGNLNVKEKGVLTILEMCNEMYARGIKFLPVDLYKSDAKKFLIEDDNIRIPFTAIKGLGLSVAESIVEAREEEFFTKEDLMARTRLSTTLLEMLEKHGCLEGLPDSSQLSLF